MDTLIQEKVSQKANELTATYDEKIMNYEDRYITALASHHRMHSSNSHQGAGLTTTALAHPKPT